MSRLTEEIRAFERMGMITAICATLSQSPDKDLATRTVRNWYIGMGMDRPDIEEAIDIAWRLSWVGQDV